MAEEFKAIETQEALDAVIKDRLARNTRTVTEEVTKKFEGWVSPADAKKSADQIAALTEQVAALQGQITELTAKSTAAELGALRQRIAHETGLPFELADRLNGSTEEELRKDAEVFAKFAAPQPAPSPAFSPEQPVGTAQNAAFLALANDLKS